MYVRHNGQQNSARDLKNARCGQAPGVQEVGSEPVDVYGSRGEIVRCADGTLLVLWVRNGDQLALRMWGGDRQEASEFLALARSVRFAD
jgi:hypothetical protein